MAHDFGEQIHALDKTQQIDAEAKVRNEGQRGEARAGSGRAPEMPVHGVLQQVWRERTEESRGVERFCKQLGKDYFHSVSAV